MEFTGMCLIGNVFFFAASELACEYIEIGVGFWNENADIICGICGTL